MSFKTTPFNRGPSKKKFFCLPLLTLNINMVSTFFHEEEILIYGLLRLRLPLPFEWQSNWLDPWMLPLTCLKEELVSFTNRHCHFSNKAKFWCFNLPRPCSPWFELYTPNTPLHRLNNKFSFWTLRYVSIWFLDFQNCLIDL